MDIAVVFSEQDDVVIKQFADFESNNENMDSSNNNNNDNNNNSDDKNNNNNNNNSGSDSFSIVGGVTTIDEDDLVIAEYEEPVPILSSSSAAASSSDAVVGDGGESVGVDSITITGSEVKAHPQQSHPSYEGKKVSREETTHKKKKKKTAGSSLRSRKNVNYSEVHSDEEQEEESKLKASKEFEEEQNSAIASGLSPFKMTPLEVREMADHVGLSSYFEIRNHILARWHKKVGHYLTKSAASERIQPKYRKALGRVYDFLERYGYINMGCFEVPEGVSTLDGSEKGQERAKRHVVVIGGGMAGLAAARQLKHFGYNVIVLEGRDRVGGRAFTDFSTFGGAVDLGGSIITGLEGNPLTILCKQLNLRLHPLEKECPLFDFDGYPVPADVDKRMETLFNSLLDQSTAFKKSVATTNPAFSADGQSLDLPEGCGKSLGLTLEYLISKQDPPLASIERRVLDWHFANLEYGCASELSRVSLNEWDQDDQYEFAGDHCMLPTGYGSVAKAMAASLDVRFGKVVTEIQYSPAGDGRAQVVVADGEVVAADAVLVTVPLGVLKSETIKFTPPLPDWKMGAISRLGFGLLNKVVLLFSKAFWSQELDYFGIVQNTTESRGEGYLFWNLQRVMGRPVLVTLVAGAASYAIETQNDNELVSRVVSALKNKFGDVVPFPEKSVVTHWYSEPLSRGSYSYIAIGSSGADYDILARSVGNLYFAGEATIREHPATVAGAFLSGLRESGNIDRDACSTVEQRELRDTAVARASYSAAADGARHSARSRVGGEKRKYISSESLEWLFVQSYRIPKKQKVAKKDRPLKDKRPEDISTATSQHHSEKESSEKEHPEKSGNDSSREKNSERSHERDSFEGNRNRNSFDRSGDNYHRNSRDSYSKNRDREPYERERDSYNRNRGRDSFERNRYPTSHDRNRDDDSFERNREGSSFSGNREDNSDDKNVDRERDRSRESDSTRSRSTGWDEWNPKNAEGKKSGWDVKSEADDSNSFNDDKLNSGWNGGNNYRKNAKRRSSDSFGHNYEDDQNSSSSDRNRRASDSLNRTDSKSQSESNTQPTQYSDQNQYLTPNQYPQNQNSNQNQYASQYSNQPQYSNQAQYPNQNQYPSQSQYSDQIPYSDQNQYSTQYQYVNQTPNPPPFSIFSSVVTHPIPSPTTAPPPTSSSTSHPSHPFSASSQSTITPTLRFRDMVSDVVVERLNKYNHAGRIRTPDAFRHLARKLTHQCIEKERRLHASHVGSASELTMTDEIKKKIGKLIDGFFSKLDGIYPPLELK